MSTHNICLYKEVDIKYTGCNLKTMELLDCALIGVCAVIRSNTVSSEGVRFDQITILALRNRTNRHEQTVYNQIRRHIHAAECGV